MTLKEFYAAVGGDYDATLNRIPKESMVLRFVKKYADDKTYAQLTEAVGNQRTGKRRSARRTRSRAWRRTSVLTACTAPRSR